MKPYHADVKNAILKMRRTQVAFTLMHLLSLGVTFFIAIGVLLPYWFILLALMSLETSASTFTFVMFSLSRLRKHAKKPKARGMNGNADGVVGDKLGDDTTTSPTPGGWGSSVVLDLVPAGNVAAALSPNTEEEEA